MKDEKDYSFEKGYMSIHELLAANGVNQRNLINEIEREEKVEGRESYDMIEADIKGQQEKTKKNKQDFIKEMKMGLGKSIKENPNTVKVGGQTLWARIGKALKRIFTKF